MKIIDLSHTIREGMPVFFGSAQPMLTKVARLEKNGYRETELRMFSHVGTHMDAPAHILSGGETLDGIPAERFVGKAVVIDCSDLQEGQSIGMEKIRPCMDQIMQADFVLFCTEWDRYWGVDTYYGNYPCVDESVLNYLCTCDLKGVGFDTISPDPVNSIDLPRHRALLKSGILIVENLAHLKECPKTPFRFVCLPIRYEDADGAPARAIAWLEV